MDEFNLEDPKKADHLVPESGPGEDAAGFSAKTQQEKFLGGGGNQEITPQQPEAGVEAVTPTRASRSFLERTGQRIKRDWRILLPGVGIIALSTGLADAPLVVKGIIAGVAVLPMAYEAYRSYKVNKAADAAEEAAEQAAEAGKTEVVAPAEGTPQTQD